MMMWTESARLLMRQRGFAGVAVVTMALAVGVTATLFSVVDAVLLRPLPWPHADRLVRLSETHTGATRGIGQFVTSAAYLAMRDRLASIGAIGAWSRGIDTMTTIDGAERVQAAAVTPGTFDMLRVVPFAGRVFSTDDAHEIVLSHGLWQTHFGGTPDAIGRAITLNGQSFTIVGVMPAEFAFPDRATRLWRPLRVPPPPAATVFGAMARLRDGATPAQAAEEATARARTATMSTNALLAWFGSRGPAVVTAEPALAALTGDVRPGIVALFGAAMLLLVAAVANLAGLQLARATTRYREMAIRSALGASTSRLVRDLVTEQLLLAISGGTLGVALAAALHKVLPSVLPPDFPRLDEIAMRLPVAFLAFGFAVASAVVLGIVPALHLRRLQLTQALGDGAAGAIGGARMRGRAGIMTTQIAVAAMLLVVALLLGRSFAAMMQQDRGFNPEHVLTARLSLPDFAFTPQARIEAVEEFVERAHTLPGAVAVAVTTGLPLSGSENITGFDMPSVRPPRGVSINVHAVRSVVTPEYLRALGLHLIAGRDFRAADDSASAPKVVIVNRTFARQYLTDTAIGDHLSNFMNGDDVPFEVIGIVEDAQRHGVGERVQPEIYSLLRQSPRPSPAQDVVIRAAGDAARTAAPMRELVRAINVQAAIDSVRTMDDRIAGSLARPRLYAVLLLVFGVSAALLAGVGLVGMLSYAVAQRTREIALRVALGATPGRIVRLVFAQGLMMTVFGLTCGVGGAFVASRYLATLVYGVSARDGVSFVAAPLALAVVSLGACTLPALRAMRIDPLTNLRG